MKLFVFTFVVTAALYFRALWIWDHAHDHRARDWYGER